MPLPAALKALNPFDVTDAESLNISQADFSVMVNVGNELAGLSAPAQGAMLGAVVATPGGASLYKRKLASGMIWGAALGAGLTALAYRLRRR